MLLIPIAGNALRYAGEHDAAVPGCLQAVLPHFACVCDFLTGKLS